MTQETLTAAAWRAQAGLQAPGADRARTARPKPVQHELALQIASSDWLRELIWPEGGRPLYTHPPLERSDKAGAVLAWRCGTRSGTPDWIFALPAGRSLWIELKVDAYPSAAQREVRDELKALGHPWRLCRSIDEMAAAMLEQGLTWIETPRARAIRLAFS